MCSDVRVFTFEFGCLFDSSVVCMVGWWFGWFVGRVGWLVGWLVGSLVDVQRVCLHLICHMFMYTFKRNSRCLRLPYF